MIVCHIIVWHIWRVANGIPEWSFFDFFTPLSPPQRTNQPQSGNKDNSDDKDEELEAYEEDLEEDFAIGEIFKGEVRLQVHAPMCPEER